MFSLSHKVTNMILSITFLILCFKIVDGSASQNISQSLSKDQIVVPSMYEILLKNSDFEVLRSDALKKFLQNFSLEAPLDEDIQPVQIEKSSLRNGFIFFEFFNDQLSANASKVGSKSGICELDGHLSYKLNIIEVESVTKIVVTYFFDTTCKKLYKWSNLTSFEEKSVFETSNGKKLQNKGKFIVDRKLTAKKTAPALLDATKITPKQVPVLVLPNLRRRK
jgi:hypothetical protein